MLIIYICQYINCFRILDLFVHFLLTHIHENNTPSMHFSSTKNTHTNCVQSVLAKLIGSQWEKCVYFCLFMRFLCFSSFVDKISQLKILYSLCALFCVRSISRRNGDGFRQLSECFVSETQEMLAVSPCFKIKFCENVCFLHLHQISRTKKKIKKKKHIALNMKTKVN